MGKYLPELSSLLDSLDNYSICERHYNQVIVKKSFVKQLTKLDDSSFSDSDEKEESLLIITMRCKFVKKAFPISESSIYAGSSVRNAFEKE